MDDPTVETGVPLAAEPIALPTIEPVEMPILSISCSVDELVREGWQDEKILEFVGKLKDVLAPAPKDPRSLI